MDNPGTNNSSQASQAIPISHPGENITPQLIKEIADQVYALLVHDLKIEAERHRFAGPGSVGAPGGTK